MTRRAGGAQFREAGWKCRRRLAAPRNEFELLRGRLMLYHHILSQSLQLTSGSRLGGTVQRGSEETSHSGRTSEPTNVGLIERAHPGPGGGPRFTRFKLLAGTVFRRDWDALRNVSQRRGTAPRSSWPLMGGRAVS